MASTSRLLVAIVEICLEAKNWSALNEHIILLSKRRSQLKQAVTKMVQECCTYVDKMPNKETMVKLIETLRSVTEGKVNIFLTFQAKLEISIFHSINIEIQLELFSWLNSEI